MGALPNIKVRVAVRDDNDPDFDVPVQIHCPQCPGWALLQQFLVGYGYICQTCDGGIPIIIVPSERCYRRHNRNFNCGRLECWGAADANLGGDKSADS